MIACVGELLIDFVATTTGRLEDAPSFLKAPGGAVANVAVWLAHFGQPVSFLGAVGDDAFGRYLRESLEAQGVDAGGLQVRSDATTTLAFVSLTEDGERDFSFLSGADARFELTPPLAEYISRADWLHFGGVSLSREPARCANWQAVAVARQRGISISFDANLRPSLWADIGEAGAQLRRAVRESDVVKISEVEATFLTGETDPEAALLALQRLLTGAPTLLVALTLGEQGSFYLLPASGEIGSVPAVPTHAVDTTGAGDAFMATLIAELRRHGSFNLTARDLKAIFARANNSGAAAVQHKGAWPDVEL